jgi:MoaA/NifB/PqqE/SkfB family radical SAM enzyme
LSQATEWAEVQAMREVTFNQYWSNVVPRRIKEDVWLIDPRASYKDEAARILVLPHAVSATSRATSAVQLKALLKARYRQDIWAKFNENSTDNQSSFLPGSRSFIYETSHPWKVGFELTSECNFRCKHCYASTLKKGLPSTKEVLLLIDQMAKAGVLWLWFTGGECTTRPDFLRLYEYAKQQGFIVSFLTNAALITDDLVATLAAYPPFVVKVSLYGASGRAYEAMTGRAENYEKTRIGIEKLLRGGVNVTVQCVTTELNESDVGQMEEYCRTLGVTHNFATRMIPRLDGDPSPTALRASVLHLNTAYLDEYATFFCDTMHLAGNLREDARRRDMFFCGAGLCFCFVSSDLCLLPCLLGREYGKNLRECGYDFRRAFELIAEERPHYLTVSSECRGCASIPFCHLCHFRRSLYRNAQSDIEGSCADVKSIHQLVIEKGGIPQ